MNLAPALECSFGLLFVSRDDDLLIAVFDSTRRETAESDWCVYGFYVERAVTLYPDGALQSGFYSYRIEAEETGGVRKSVGNPDSSGSEEA